MASFELSNKEQARAQAWIEKHSKEHAMEYTGVIGGRWTYAFTPTSIGTMAVVRCTCGAEEDIGDMTHGWDEFREAAAKRRAERGTRKD